MKELNDTKEMNFTVFMGNLKTHEIEIKAREAREPQKKKGVAFKVDQSESEDDDEDVLKDKDEYSMLVKNVARLIYNRGNFNHLQSWKLQEGKMARKR